MESRLMRMFKGRPKDVLSMLFRLISNDCPTNAVRLDQSFPVMEASANDTASSLSLHNGTELPTKRVDLPSSFDESSNDSACDLLTQFEQKMDLNGSFSADKSDVEGVVDSEKLADSPYYSSGIYDISPTNNQMHQESEMSSKSHHNSGDSGNVESPVHAKLPQSTKSRKNKPNNHQLNDTNNFDLQSSDSSGLPSNSCSPSDTGFLYGSFLSTSPLESLNSPFTYNMGSLSAIDVFEFELPRGYGGRLIGKAGINIKDIQKKSGARIVVSEHAYLKDISICSVSGDRLSIDMALGRIRSLFPLDEFPNITMDQVNIWPSTPTAITLPLSVTDVIMSSLVSAGHFFLQQPFQPTYPSLSILNEDMTKSYSQVMTPSIPAPAIGMIVAAPVMGGWYRAVILEIGHEEPPDEVQVVVKFVDYGGYLKIKVSSLRQIRMDYMQVPFQACECFLSDVGPAQGNQWSPEAGAFFESLAHGQELKAVVTAVTLEGSYLVRLYRVEEVTGSVKMTPNSASASSDTISQPCQHDDSNTSYRTVFINEELVRAGHAKWLEPLVSSPESVDSNN